MRVRNVCLACVFAWGASAAERKPPSGRAATGDVEVTATVYADKQTVTQAVGNDLGGYFIVVQARVEPKGGRKLAVHRDDFLLRSDKDGQKCQPFAPSQIAGRGALVITEKGGTGMMAEQGGPVWGGYPVGMPRRLGGESVSMGGAPQTSAEATADSGSKEKDNPLLQVLKDKALPEKETAEPVSGLLYFSLEGKHKPKDLELIYQGPGGKAAIRFRD